MQFWFIGCFLCHIWFIRAKQTKKRLKKKEYHIIYAVWGKLLIESLNTVIQIFDFIGMTEHFFFSFKSDFCSVGYSSFRLKMNNFAAEHRQNINYECWNENSLYCTVRVLFTVIATDVKQFREPTQNSRQNLYYNERVHTDLEKSLNLI